MVLGYARNGERMSILILDPQEQFYEDHQVLPEGARFEEAIRQTGMEFSKYKVPEDIALPNDAKLFSELLLNYGFVRKALRLHTREKRMLMAESIQDYITGRMMKPSFVIGDQDSDKLLEELIARFNRIDSYNDKGSNKYLRNVYSSGQYLNNLKERISDMAEGNIDPEAKKTWTYVCGLFQQSGKQELAKVVESVVGAPNHLVVLNISGRHAASGMESLQTLFIKIIEDAVKERGAELYAQGEQANCLIVLDEAHRFISTYSSDQELKDLTTSIIDAVRTTRKYGIGYMFITQTIDSLHEEIRRQIRIFAFGYGLTSGSEFRKIREIINDDMGAKFYRSFIDPSSNNKFPFMFYGPISPLSFTGTPLFLEMNGQLQDFSEREE